MISFCEGKYLADNDKYNWILREKIKVTNKKTGEVVDSFRKTYHPNIVSICETIINREGKNCNSIDQLKELYFDSVCMLDGVIDEVINEDIESCEHKEMLFDGSCICKQCGAYIEK